MLRMDPTERYSVAEALHDPYVRKWFREDEVRNKSEFVFWNKSSGERTSLEKPIQLGFGWGRTVINEIELWVA